MIIKGRLPTDNGEFQGSLLPNNRGVRVDHSGLPAFWVEALFDPDDIDQLATKYIFVMERVVKYEGSEILGIYRRLGTARRIAHQQPLPSYGEPKCWSQLISESKDIVVHLKCSDISITITKMRILP